MKRLSIFLTALSFSCSMFVWADDCTPVGATYLTTGIDDMIIDGDSYVWEWDGTYNCAKATRTGIHTGYLMTPTLNLSGAQSVTLSFDHAHKFAGDPAQELTLWVTANYLGSFDGSQWQQLTISPYSAQTSWAFVSVTINIPIQYVGTNTVFAFKYMTTDTNNAMWEVKNLSIISECPGGGLVPPVDLPNVGDGRLKIFAQNVQNYYFHYDNYSSSRANYDHAAFAAKTRKMVNAMLMVDADIFALCEVEAQPEVLAQLADSMNARVEGTPYTAIADGINVAWDSYDNNIKAGFIYRNDKVEPVGSNYAGSTAEYYQNTQRIQAFKELSSNERFTLAMNHFKAKDSSDDQGNSKREMNANHILSRLNSYALDPDILILGDLNCEVGESPITIIQNAGYEEQLLKFNSSAYSHCYNGGELIDHAFANASMAAMITGAGVFHISTSCGADAAYNAGYRYSDHDPYVVAINLPEKSDECNDIDDTYLTSGLGDFTTDDANVWSWYSSYGYAKAVKSGGYEANLLSPEFDLSEMKAVTLSFSHTHKYAGTPSDELTLWVTKDYKGSFAASEWQQLTIDPYNTDQSNWNWKDVTINVPSSYVGSKTVFAFHYMSTTDHYAQWEVKRFNIQATCDSTTAIVNTTVEKPQAQKIIVNGQMFLILPDGSTYNIMGQKIQ